MATKAFKVISVFSTSKEEFDPGDHRNFFLLDYEDIICNSVEAFEEYVGADFNVLAFRQRLIPTVKEIVTIPLGEKSTSKELVKFSGSATDTIEISDTEPYNKQYDGIITSLSLFRYANRDIYRSDTLLPHGLGIVAWAVMHEIPVGIVYDDRSKDRQQNFYIESVLDTLQSHPCCKGAIFSGDTREVCHDMYRFLEGK